MGIETNRLSEDMTAILNRQITQEAQQAQIYLSYAIWADDKGYSGIANLLFRHSGEERDHMMKFIKYVQGRGGKAKVGALEAVTENPKDIQDCFERIYKHEVENTESIYKIVELAQEEKDWATWNFTQWFVKEQIEEETLAMDLLDMLKIAGGPDASDESLFYLDKTIGNQEDEADIARTANVENPQ